MTDSPLKYLPWTCSPLAPVAPDVRVSVIKAGDVDATVGLACEMDWTWVDRYCILTPAPPPLAPEVEAQQLIDSKVGGAAQRMAEAYLKMRGRKDDAYTERNRVVAALATCFPSGIAVTAIEGWHPEWHGCVYIDLPTGQASWHYHDSQAPLFQHLPPYTGTWDGHTTEEKYERLAKLNNGTS